MPAEVARWIGTYGYAAIFALVFLQEIGVPNPVTNEFVLLFSGYLAFTGALNLWLAMLTAVAADCTGTTLLYCVFYRCGARLVERPPRWLPISRARIERLTKTVAQRGRWGIFVGRLLPFVRGYASVAAGLLGIPPRNFLPAVAVSAVVWSGGYVVAGRLLGPYWAEVAERAGRVGSWALAAALIGALIWAGRAATKSAVRNGR